MFENYEVAVKIKLTDNASAGVLLLAKHILKTEEAAGKLQARLNAIKALMTAGAGFMGAGAAIGAPLIYAIDKAAELQKQLISVQIATRGTTEQMNNMRKAIESIAAQTMFSNIDVAKMAKQIATGTALKEPQVQGLLPAYAKYADVQLLLKGTPYTQSVNDALRAAHGAGHYDPASLSKYLDLLTKASLIVPGSNSEVVRGLAYFQNTAKTALGMDDENSILAVALANRLGFAGTRGGNNLTAALTRSIPGVFGSGLLKGKSAEALRDMGMVDAQGHAKVFGKDGKFDMMTWMGLTADFVTRELASNPANVARQNIMRDFSHAYGVNGMRLGAALGSPQAIEQWNQIGAQFDEFGGFEGMQKRFADDSVSQQWQNAKTNFISAMTELGTTLLPTATKYLKELNTHLGKLIEWMSKNPGKVGEYAKNIAKLALALGGLGIVSTVTGAITGLVTALGLLQAAAIAAASAAAANTTATTVSRAGKAGVLGLTGWLAYEAATMLGADKLGNWLGGKAYDFAHPYNPNANSTTLHTHTYIDGKKVAESVTKHQAKAFSVPQTGSSFYDALQGPMPAGGLP
jgi:TP901 family phage tail tape measure protein